MKVYLLAEKRMATYDELRALYVMTQVVKQSAWLHDYSLVDGDLVQDTQVVYICTDLLDFLEEVA